MTAKETLSLLIVGALMTTGGSYLVGSLLSAEIGFMFVQALSGAWMCVGGMLSAWEAFSHIRSPTR